MTVQNQQRIRCACDQRSHSLCVRAMCCLGPARSAPCAPDFHIASISVCRVVCRLLLPLLRTLCYLLLCSRVRRRLLPLCSYVALCSCLANACGSVDFDCSFFCVFYSVVADADAVSLSGACFCGCRCLTGAGGVAYVARFPVGLAGHCRLTDF